MPVLQEARSCSVVGATSTQFLGGVKCDDLDVYRPIASAGGLALAGMNVERLGIHLVDCKVDRLVVNGVVAELSMFADRELDMDLAQVQGLRSMRIRLPSESIVAARYPKSLRELKYFTRGGENLDWALRSKVHEDCELIESIR